MFSRYASIELERLLFLFWTLDAKNNPKQFWIPDSLVWTMDSPNWIPDSLVWTMDSPNWIPDSPYWIPDSPN